MPIGVFEAAGDDEVNKPPDAGSSDQEYRDWVARVEKKQSVWAKNPKNADAVKRAAQTRREVAAERRAHRKGK